ncbi:MAG: hypothetical protein V5783_05115 [Pontiella sp.]
MEIAWEQITVLSFCWTRLLRSFIGPVAAHDFADAADDFLAPAIVGFSPFSLVGTGFANIDGSVRSGLP